MAVRKTHFLRGFHLGAAIFWALMAVPTILWFRDSILWVAFMSLYANFAAEMAGYQAARAEVRAQKERGPGQRDDRD